MNGAIQWHMVSGKWMGNESCWVYVYTVLVLQSMTPVHPSMHRCAGFSGSSDECDTGLQC